MLAALVAALTVGGACSRGGDSDRAEGADEAQTAVDQEASGTVDAGVVADGAASATGGGSVAAPSVVPASVAETRIVKTATLHIEVKDGTFDTAFTEVATIASSVGGFVAASTSSSKDDGASASLTLRVPAASFDDVRARVSKLGERRGEELRGDDVGGQLTDLEARLRNLRAQEEAIRALMGRTRDVNETLQIQGQLGGVREQIEQLDAQRARLQDAVTYATVTVQLTEPGVTPVEEEPSPLSSAVERAVNGAEAIVAGLIIAVGYLFPIALLALAGLAVARLVRHRPVATVASPEHGA